MKAAYVSMVVCLSAYVFAQTPGTGGGGYLVNRRAVASDGLDAGYLQVRLRADPPSLLYRRPFVAAFRNRIDDRRNTFSSRWLIDSTNHVYFGYELLLEEQGPGKYLATFGKLSLSSLEVAASMAPRIPPTAPVKSLKAV